MGALLELAVSFAQGAVTLPSGFTHSRVVSGLTNPMDMEFAPTTGCSWLSKQGALIAKPDGMLTTFLDISARVDSADERGLQSLTFDPNFSTSHYIHLTCTRRRRAPPRPTTLSCAPPPTAIRPSRAVRS